MNVTRVKGMGGLVAAIPQIYGSDPEPGLLVVLESEDGVEAVSRWDAAATTAPSSVSQLMRQQVELSGARRAILIAYRLDPGAADVLSAAKLFDAVLPVHHVLSTTHEHWWANRCDVGCCDGAVHPLAGSVPISRPNVRADGTHEGASFRREPQASRGRGGSGVAHSPAPTIDAAWRRIAAVAPTAPDPVRHALRQELDVVLEALTCASTRDRVLMTLAPEVMRASDAEHAGDIPEDAVGSRVLEAWLPHIPSEARSQWLGCLALAHWREGDSVKASACAGEAVGTGTSTVASLMVGILGAGLSYEKARRRMGRAGEVEVTEAPRS